MKEEVASKEKLAREGSGLRSEVHGLRKDLARKAEEVQAIRKDATNKIRHVEWLTCLCVLWFAALQCAVVALTLRLPSSAVVRSMIYKCCLLSPLQAPRAAVGGGTQGGVGRCGGTTPGAAQ